MRVLHQPTISRATFLRGLAGGVAIAAVGGPWTAVQVASAASGESEDGKLLPLPKPIAGGLAPGFHVFAPGSDNITLPFSHLLLQGLDVEPNTMTDFKGFIAQAYHVGTAKGSDGQTYNLETDIRAYKGEYIDADGSHHKGSFALV